MTLYEIDARMEGWEPDVDIETGEVTNFAELDELKLAKDEKVENIALWIKNLRAEAMAIRDEETRLAERRRWKEQKADRLEDYLSDALTGEKFETARVKVQWTTSKSVELDEAFTAWAAENRPELLTQNPRPNKVKIRKELNEGQDIAFAHMIERKNILIR